MFDPTSAHVMETGWSGQGSSWAQREDNKGCPGNPPCLLLLLLLSPSNGQLASDSFALAPSLVTLGDPHGRGVTPHAACVHPPTTLCKGMASSLHLQYKFCVPKLADEP